VTCLKVYEGEVEWEAKGDVKTFTAGQGTFALDGNPAGPARCPSPASFDEWLQATEHDQPAVAIQARPRVRIALEVHELDPMPAAPDQWIERAERLGGDVLEDEDSRHGVEGCAGENSSRSARNRQCRQSIPPVCLLSNGARGSGSMRKLQSAATTRP